MSSENTGRIMNTILNDIRYCDSHRSLDRQHVAHNPPDNPPDNPPYNPPHSAPQSLRQPIHPSSL